MERMFLFIKFPKVHALFIVGMLFIVWGFYWVLNNIVVGLPFHFKMVVPFVAGLALMVMFLPKGMTKHQLGFVIGAIVVCFLVSPFLFMMIYGLLWILIGCLGIVLVLLVIALVGYMLYLRKMKRNKQIE
jgi:hypothetical protein